MLQCDIVYEFHNGSLHQHEEIGCLITQTLMTVSKFFYDLCEKVETEVQIVIGMLVVKGMIVVPHELINVD